MTGLNAKHRLAGTVLLWLLAVSYGQAADVTVAPNGDGQFNSTQAAIMAAPQGLPSAAIRGVKAHAAEYNIDPKRIAAAGVPCDLITIPDGAHGMARWESFAPEFKEQVADWLARHLGVAAR